MADNTHIEWADATVNAVNGCSVLSPGCTNCYAMKLAGTRLKHVPSRAGLTQDSKAGPVWTGEVRLDEKQLLQPLRWKRPRRIFWNAHGDPFHPNVPWEWTAKVMASAFLSPHHIHMILTKRADRMNAWFDTLATEGGAEDFSEIIELMAESVGRECDYPEWTLPLKNVWLGVSVEDQARADERIPDLLATPAVVRFLSCEPLLGPVDLRWIAEPDEDKDGVIDALLGCNWIDGSVYDRGEEFRPVRPGHEGRVMRRWVCSPEADILANRKLDWIIVGGESGPGARPMHPDWARSLRDQCQAAGVAFHFKQWGEWFPYGHVDADGNVNTQCRGEKAGLWHEWPTCWTETTDHLSVRIGKKRAGRLLDGREWNEVPV